MGSATQVDHSRLAVGCPRSCQPLWSPGYAAALPHTPEGAGRRNNSDVPRCRASQPPFWQLLQVGPQPQSAGSFLRRWIRSPTVTVGVQPRPWRRRLARDAAPDSATAVQAALVSSPFPSRGGFRRPRFPGGRWGQGEKEGGDREQGTGAPEPQASV